jgi:SAM-dependent methyltransferase
MQLTALINDGESVLDVGCGPGHNLDHFMLYGPAISNYKGIDYSIRFVRAANERAKQLANTSSGPFALGDVRDIKEEPGSWDVVVLQDVLEHTNGYEGPVKGALEVAKKRVIVSFWHLTENDDHINDDGDDGWGAWYSRPKWEKFLDSLDVHWLHHQVDDGNKPRDFYVLDKEVPHGLSSV